MEGPHAASAATTPATGAALRRERPSTSHTWRPPPRDRDQWLVVRSQSGSAAGHADTASEFGELTLTRSHVSYFVEQRAVRVVSTAQLEPGPRSRCREAASDDVLRRRSRAAISAPTLWRTR
jgi:hypothetical protein